MLRVEVSYWHEGKQAYDWLDITEYLKAQFNNQNGLPSGLKEGIYPDDIATDEDGARWYDLIDCVVRAVKEQEKQVEIAKTVTPTDGSNPVAAAESKLNSLQNFFDGGVHALRIHDTESSGTDKFGRGIMLRMIMEYRYTSRNA